MFEFFEVIFAPLVFILQLIAIFDVTTGPKETSKKVLWTLLILLLPLVGLILYYLLGKENLPSRLKPQQ